MPNTVNDNGLTIAQKPRLICAMAAIVLMAIPHVTSAETLFVHVKHASNSYGNEITISVLEGMLDGFFENGHIAFDSGAGLESDSTPALVRIARFGGAQYLVVVTVTGQMPQTAESQSEIAASALYEVFEAAYGRRVFDGEADTGVAEGEQRSKEQTVFFSLGQELSLRIHRHFTSIAVQSTK